MGRTVLLGWEVGNGLSHVQALLRLARALAAEGCRPVLALRDLLGPWPVLADEPFPVVQAPFAPPTAWTGPEPFTATSHADLLALQGFATAEELEPRVGAWGRLLGLVRPDLVIGEFSPTLCLAARGRLPFVEIGSGFTMPPLSGPTFPLLLDGPRQVAGEEQILAAVREVERRRGGACPDTLPAVFADAERCLTVLPELDPYRPLRTEPWLGPLEPLPPLVPPPDEPSFFAYLHAATTADDILMALAAVCPGQVYLGGCSAARYAALRRQGVTVLERPLDLTEALPRFRVIVHHAGIVLSQLALAAGRPQLFLPEHLENRLNAHLLQQLGAGLNPGPTITAAGAAATLRRLLQPDADRQAGAAADAVHAGGPYHALPRVLDRCRALLNRASGAAQERRPLC
jgi:UDP:flavonoid glycosyltransferase YjiC (YdhE family)